MENSSLILANTKLNWRKHHAWFICVFVGCPFSIFFFIFSLTGKYVFHFNGNEITLDMTSTYTTYQQQQQQYISIFSQTICIIYFHNLHFTYVEYKVRVLSATIRLNLSSCNNSSFFFFWIEIISWRVNHSEWSWSWLLTVPFNFDSISSKLMRWHSKGFSEKRIAVTKWNKKKCRVLLNGSHTPHL